LNEGTPVVYNYGYDSVWKDKLVSFDGKSLTYDAIGNPLTIGDSVLTWIQGRKLSTFKKDATSDTATYTYDENGIRKTKVVGDEVIEYITSGGEVVAQRSNNGTTGDSSDDVVITFTRGADGSLISMNRNGTTYYYVTNIQGDVEQILDSTGAVVVSYVYDAYGRVVSISGTHASTIGEENPFRYRSYYFDNESGYYYLQSRYYDSLMGRFISEDGQINEGYYGNNKYSYCENNPINYVDKEGNILETILDIGGIAWSVVDLVKNPSLTNVGFLVWDVGATIIPFVPGSYVVKSIKISAKAMAKTDDVIDVAKLTYKIAEKSSAIKTCTGSYEIVFKSSLNYVGKGGYKRMIKSASRIAESNSDDVVSMMWKPAKSTKRAFVDEYLQMLIRGVNNKNTYNKIWSPGKLIQKNELWR